MTETLKDGAKRLAQPWFAKGYRAAGLHVYRDASGNELFGKFRLEHADGDAAPEGRKVIRPFHANGNGSCVMGEPRFERGRKPLYHLQRIAAKLDCPVWITEGEKAADALVRIGALATTSGSASSDEAADWSPLSGRTCYLWADFDDEGRAYIGRVAERLLELGCSIEVVDVDSLGLPPKGDAADWLSNLDQPEYDDLERLPRVRAELNKAPEPAKVDGPAYISRRLSDVVAKPIAWLWPGRIARGKVSMVAGHPGLGKSQLTAAIAAVVSNGGEWPVERTRADVGSVIFLNAEDDAADTIRPRLEAAGADLTRCEILDAVVDGVDKDGNMRRRGFSLKSDLRTLELMLSQRPDCALVVIDPISAYLSGVDSHTNADVRAVLAPLGELAAKYGVAVVVVSHLNKAANTSRTAGEAQLRVSGSLAFVAAARAAHIVVIDPEDDSRRLFLPAKNNLAKDNTGLAFVVESHTLDSGIETSRVMWERELVTISAEEAMAPPPDEGEQTMTRDAENLLKCILMHGRVNSRDIKRQAQDAGISDKALRRARERMGIQIEREGSGAEMKSYWLRPGTSFVPSYPIPAPVENGARILSEGTNGAESGTEMPI